MVDRYHFDVMGHDAYCKANYGNYVRYDDYKTLEDAYNLDYKEHQELVAAVCNLLQYCKPPVITSHEDTFQGALNKLRDLVGEDK